MVKRKKTSVRAGVKSKVARSLASTVYNTESQSSQLDDSWSSDDNSSKCGNNASCKVCKEDIVLNPQISTEICHLKCCICDNNYHGECLSLDESLLPHLHLMMAIGGWCCAPCRRRVRGFADGAILSQPVAQVVFNPLQLPDPAASTSVSDLDNVLDLCKKLNTEISDMKLQMRTITEFLSPIVDTVVPTVVPSGVVTSAEKSSVSWSKIVQNKTSSKTEVKQPTINSVLKAVHGDLLDKQRRAKNVLITGLKPVQSVSDSDLFQRFCFDHLGLTLTAPFCRRFGDAKNGRIQRLLVSLQDEIAADNVLKLAKILRKSNDVYIKSNVYINRDLTKAEAAAEYEARQARRKRKAGRNQPQSSDLEVGKSDASHSGEESTSDQTCSSDARSTHQQSPSSCSSTPMDQMPSATHGTK